MILVFRLRFIIVHYKYMDSLLFEQHIYLCIPQLEIYICQINPSLGSASGNRQGRIDSVKSNPSL